MLKVRPQKHYRTPKYPTMEHVTRNPTLLCRLPMRWHTRPAVCAALTFTLTSGLFSCAYDEAAGVNERETDFSSLAGTDADNGSDGLDRSNEALGGVNVPLFEYGDGRGAFGCVSVTAPLFMSEDEVAQIITDEAAKLGIEIQQSGAPVMSDADLPETSLGHYDDLGTVKGELQTDGKVNGTAFSYEFVSREDYLDWEAKDKGPMTTVSSFDIKDAAMRLAENNQNVAAFYDPIGRVEYEHERYHEWVKEYAKSKGLDTANDDFYEKFTDEDYRIIENKWAELYRECEAIAHEKAERDLREQVKGFIEWLKGQGVI